MVNKEQRIFNFSNGCVAVATIMGVNKFITIDGQTIPFTNMTLAARQGILGIIYRATKFDMNKVKVVSEEYYCNITIPDKRVNFELKASPSGKAYSNIEVLYEGQLIYKGRQQFTFYSIRAIQDFALEKVMYEYDKKHKQPDKPEEKKEGRKEEPKKPEKKEIDPRLDKKIVSIIDFFNKLGVPYSGEPVYLESAYQEHCQVQGANFRFGNKTEHPLSVFAKINAFALDNLSQLNDFISYDLLKAVSEMSHNKKFSLCLADNKKNEYQRNIRFYNGINLVANITKRENSIEITKILLLCNFGRNRKKELISKALKGEV